MSSAVVTTLDRSADALLQQKALQSSHHERLEEDLQRLTRSVKLSLVQSRDSVLEVKRLREDLRDQQEETVQLEKALQSQHHLRLSMLSALRVKSIEKADEVTEKLGNAPLPWTGVVQRLGKLTADIGEYESLRKRAAEAGDTFFEGAECAAAARGLLGWSSAVCVVDAVLRDSAALCTTVAAWTLESEEKIVSGRQCTNEALNASAQLSADQLEIDTRIVTLRESIGVAASDVDIKKQQLVVAQQELERAASNSQYLKAQQQLASAAAGVCSTATGLFADFLSGAVGMVVDYFESLSKQREELESQLAAVRATRQAADANVSRLQSLMSTLEVSAQKHSHFRGCSTALQQAFLQTFAKKQTEIRAARVNLEALEDKRTHTQAAIQAVAADLEQLRSDRREALRAAQAALTRLLVDEMPASLQTVRSEEEDAWHVLMEEQLNDFSNAIHGAALRQQQQEVAAERERAAQRETELQSSRQAQRRLDEEPAARRTVGHTMPMFSQAQHSQQATSRQNNSAKLLMAPQGPSNNSTAKLQGSLRQRTLMARPANRQESPALSVWSVAELPPPHITSSTKRSSTGEGNPPVLRRPPNQDVQQQSGIPPPPSPLPREPTQKRSAAASFAALAAGRPKLSAVAGKADGEQQQRGTAGGVRLIVPGNSQQGPSLAATLRKQLQSTGKQRLLDVAKKEHVPSGGCAGAESANDFDVFAL